MDLLPLFWLGHLAILTVSTSILLQHQRPPASAVAWLMSILFLPYLGACLFLLFGMNRVSRRREAWWLQRRRKVQRVRPEAAQACALTRFNALQARLARLCRTTAGTDVTCGNRIRLLPRAPQAFAAIERAIEGAAKCVHVQYYIYRPDRLGRRIRDLLITRARQGIEIRFMYDGIGSWGLNREFLQPMVDQGIRVSPFLPGRTLRERWSVNLRNHRKLVIVDNRTAFTGGLNVGDEYLGRDPEWGYWRDTHLSLQGPAVSQLVEVFAEDWYCATDESIGCEALSVSDDANRGTTPAQTVSDGPDRILRPLRSLMLAAILEAEERITLSTGYFVPPVALQEALCTSAARGVKVRILVAGRATYWYTLWAGRSYYAELLNLGAKIYEYQRGLFHAKAMTVDGCWSLIGTPNFDARSLELNFEVALSLFDHQLAAELERQFEHDVHHSREFERERWSRRSTWRVRGENFCRLFAPLL